MGHPPFFDPPARVSLCGDRFLPTKIHIFINQADHWRRDRGQGKGRIQSTGCGNNEWHAEAVDAGSGHAREETGGAYLCPCESGRDRRKTRCLDSPGYRKKNTEEQRMQNMDELCKRYANGMVKAADENEIPLEELNFKKCIIGSDEAGKGEIFRPLVTVAAYVRPENMDGLIAMGVKDSKAYGKNFEEAKEKFYPIGEVLTGVTSYRDFEGREGKVIRTGCATFVARVLTNQKFNEVFKPGSGKKSGNLHNLLGQEHKAALLALAGEASYDYIVVDDFQNGLHHDTILKEMDIPAGQAVIATKADSQVMAVACASVIAYYLSNLYVDALDQMLESKYGIRISLDRGADYKTEAFREPLRKLNKISKEDYERFVDDYAKRHYIVNMEL